MLSTHPFDLLRVRAILVRPSRTHKRTWVELRWARVAVVVKSIFAIVAIFAFLTVASIVAEMTRWAGVVVPTFEVSKSTLVAVQWEVASTHSTRTVNAVTAGLAFAAGLAEPAWGAELSAEALPMRPARDLDRVESRWAVHSDGVLPGV